jgi:type I restriction-modification system DNA methylase subunit
MVGVFSKGFLLFGEITMLSNLGLDSETLIRVENNLQALTALMSKFPCSERLKNYSGWGGLSSAFYDPKIYTKIQNLLNEHEIDGIKKSLKTAYYTPKPLVDFMYKMIIDLGCNPATILEPSAGHGVFIDRMPHFNCLSKNVTAVEIDPVSCRLLRALYPDVDIIERGFESIAFDRKFDLIIGNPPFGQFFVEDRINPDLSSYSIHHFFVSKCMRLLNDNGILAMLLPRYFMDASQKHVRKIIADEGGSLVSAFRLPDNLFDNATVTIDLVFLKKSAGNARWVQAKPLKDGKNFAFINQYFIDNPVNIIGKIEFFDIYNRTEITCKQKFKDIYFELNKKLSNNFNATKDNCKIYKSRETIKKYICIVQSQIHSLNIELKKLQKLEYEISHLNI